MKSSLSSSEIMNIKIQQLIKYRKQGIYLLFHTTSDIMQRKHSFNLWVNQMCCATGLECYHAKKLWFIIRRWSNVQNSKPHSREVSHDLNLQIMFPCWLVALLYICCSLNQWMSYLHWTCSHLNYYMSSVHVKNKNKALFTSMITGA